MSGDDARPIDDFARLLGLSDPVLVVGGQAVNLWAVYYEGQTKGLAPFVSRDVDVLGDRALLDALAKHAGVAPKYFPLKPPSNEIGVVIAKDGQGRPLIIEVLRYIHGVSNDQLQQPVYTFEIRTTRLRAPGPIVLLQAKIANAADIPQSGRQDLHHVLILSRLIPAYLRDLHTAITGGKLLERQLVRSLEQLLQIVISEKARTVFSKLGISPSDHFEELMDSRLMKVQQFYKERLPRLLPE